MKTPVKYLIERFELSCGKDFITGYNTYFKNALKMEEETKKNERNAGRKEVLKRVLRGKYLVRKSKLENGTEVITLSGVFHPQNFDINEIKYNDEMWVSDVIVSSGGIRFTDPNGTDGGSLEDFISGINQSPSNWKTKDLL